MLAPEVIVALSVGCAGITISLFALLKKYKVLSSFRWPSTASLHLPSTNSSLTANGV